MFLTGLTQTGGVVLLISMPFFRLVDKKTGPGFKRNSGKFVIFLILYLFSVFVVIPPLAKALGRTALPFCNSKLRPLNPLTYLLNRHYVSPVLLSTVERVAEKMDQEHPGTIVAYLDANFPFWDGFPLFPHLSHNDGKKIDLAFFYLDAQQNQELNCEAPSFIGYGGCVEPVAGEINVPLQCREQGYWQYDLLRKWVPQWRSGEMVFDSKRTRKLIFLFVQENEVGKIFIEPHLKTRMGLKSSKIRFHGCQAVRHDDHIHIQLR